MTAPLLVVVQNWDESESGWGIRPDGYTLHKSIADNLAYRKAYWARQLKLYPTVPHEYTRESGEPFWAEVDAETYARVMESNNGIWGAMNGYFREQRK